MKISFQTRVKSPDTLGAYNGYGYATKCILDSLARLGYQVTVNDASADVGFCFDQPHHWEFFEGQYRVALHPWESTKIHKHWEQPMRAVDELWAPSPLLKRWYDALGLGVPTFVYEHGVEHVWKPQKRARKNKLRYLVLGAEATRKNGWQSMGAFKEAFAGVHDVSLTMKMVNSNWNRVKNTGKIDFINEVCSFPQLQDLFYSHDVLIHASSGEGFGLPPLQALASSMPAIVVPDWAPYERFVDDRLKVGACLVTSPWPELHPGQVFRPDRDALLKALRVSYEQFDDIADRAHGLAPQIHAEYDWDHLTRQMFSGLEKRLKSQGKIN